MPYFISTRNMGYNGDLLFIYLFNYYWVMWIKEWEYFERKTDVDVDEIISFYVIRASVVKCAVKTQKPPSEVMAR